MNHGISVLFRAIPLLMALVCFGYGASIFFTGNDSARLTAGPVVFFLGSVCVALYATAATIIRQLIGTYNTFWKYFFPLLGYHFAVATLVLGIVMFALAPRLFFVSGHVVAGLGLIGLCVSTAATSSTRFTLIPKNSASKSARPNPDGFSKRQELVMVLFVSAVSLVAWAWGIALLVGGSTRSITAGMVMCGIATVCSSLIALVASIARQVRGTYAKREKRPWMSLVLVMGSLSMTAGLPVAVFMNHSGYAPIGFILMGLGMICYSISSKVILLAKIWRADFALAKRIPVIPVLTALGCLFLAAFLVETALCKPIYFVPSRVLVGFGAICFTLFSIVSILESGTSKK